MKTRNSKKQKAFAEAEAELKAQGKFTKKAVVIRAFPQYAAKRKKLIYDCYDRFSSKERVKEMSSDIYLHLHSEVKPSIEKLAELRDNEKISPKVQLDAASKIIDSFHQSEKTQLGANDQKENTTNVLITGMTTEQIQEEIKRLTQK